MNQAEQDSLVIAAQNGNEKAFNQLYRNHHKALLRFAFKISSDEDIAQDAVQETWIKTAGSIRRLTDPRVFRSWIYRLVRWRTTDLLRQKNRQHAREEYFEEDQHETSNDNDGNHGNELQKALNRLPDVEKQMIHLFYLDELTIKEIAEVLSIPPGTVKSRLNRARRLLKQRFNI